MAPLAPAANRLKRAPEAPRPEAGIHLVRRAPGKHVRIYNMSRTEPVAGSVEVANTFRSRLQGLLGRRSLAPDCGLWLCPSNGVHTLGMRFPIDVVSLAGDMTVVGLDRCVAPWRVARMYGNTRSILELAAGRIDAAQLARGDRLAWAPCSR